MAAHRGESSQLLKFPKLLRKSRLASDHRRNGRTSQRYFGNRATPTGKRGRGSHGAWNAYRAPNYDRVLSMG
jgi:hypothetical protein